jgi:hypothetical protein
MPELAPLGVVQLEPEPLPTGPPPLLLAETGPELDALLLIAPELPDPASSGALPPKPPAPPSSAPPPSVADGDRCPPQAIATGTETTTANHPSGTRMRGHGACPVPLAKQCTSGNPRDRACQVAPRQIALSCVHGPPEDA